MEIVVLRIYDIFTKMLAIESPRKARIRTRKEAPQLFHFTTKAQRESKLSLESVKNVIKPEEMLSKNKLFDKVGADYSTKTVVW